MHVHTDTPGTLAEEFPGWHVWRSRGQDPDGEDVLKSWYAVRGQPLSGMEYRQGLYRTLAADEPTGLREQLEQQTERESKRA